MQGIKLYMEVYPLKRHTDYYILEESTQVLPITSITCVYGESPFPREKIIKETASGMIETITEEVATRTKHYLGIW